MARAKKKSAGAIAEKKPAQDFVVLKKLTVKDILMSCYPKKPFKAIMAELSAKPGTVTLFSVGASVNGLREVETDKGISYEMRGEIGVAVDAEIGEQRFYSKRAFLPEMVVDNLMSFLSDDDKEKVTAVGDDKFTKANYRLKRTIDFKAVISIVGDESTATGYKYAITFESNAERAKLPNCFSLL